MKSRFQLLGGGLFPETLPPCFISKDARRAFTGLVGKLDSKQFHTRKAEYIRYSGTKHDGSRRFFGTPNIVNYFHVCSFIWRNWRAFEQNFSLSEYSIGKPKIMDEAQERSLKVPSLSELSKHTSKNLRFAPYILKADISQCFPSIYTHSIPWAIHGIDASKQDTNEDSKTNIFNALDFFIRNGQRGNTRGILVGPDAYRLIAEFILSRIDYEISSAVGDKIVGAARHVDDYYIGLRTEHDAQSVLSHLRDVLANYELYLNDQKTRIYSSLEPINDLWAQRLRDHMPVHAYHVSHDKLERAISEAVDAAVATGSDSPIKILLRAFDESQIYNTNHWEYVEQNMQRIVQKHPHAIDYACLLVAKRFALDKPIDTQGWRSVSETIIKRSIALSHDHELIWMLWLMVVCDINIDLPLLEELQKSRNAHIRALLIRAYTEGKIRRKPKLSLGSGLASTDSNWLVHLVARSEQFSKASFSGLYRDEFEHLAQKKIVLIDLKDHFTKIQKQQKRAISRVRYGYDDDDYEYELWEQNQMGIEDNPF